MVWCSIKSFLTIERVGVVRNDKLRFQNTTKKVFTHVLNENKCTGILIVSIRCVFLIGLGYEIRTRNNINYAVC